MLMRALLILIFAAPVTHATEPIMAQPEPLPVSKAPRRETSPIGLEALLADFAAMDGLSARFREEKHLALLREPLVSHGSLYFARPDRLVRYVENPLRSVLLLSGSELSLGAGGDRRRLDLTSNPLVSALVNSFRQLLTGDLEGLRQHYRIDFEGAEGAGWQIHLVPFSPPLLRDSIAGIHFSGRGRVPTRFRVVEIGGDETVTHLYEVELNRQFDETEIAKLFQFPLP